MAEGFRSFAQIFAGQTDSHVVDGDSAEGVRGRTEAFERSAQVAGDTAHRAHRESLADAQAAQVELAADPRVQVLLDDFVADLARLRARAAEFLEARAELLLADLARGVLGRELMLAPTDVGALVRAAREQLSASPDVTVRVAAHDAARCDSAALRVGVAIDPVLGAGDFALETPEGSFACALQTRLDTLLATVRVTL